MGSSRFLPLYELDRVAWRVGDVNDDGPAEGGSSWCCGIMIVCDVGILMDLKSGFLDHCDLISALMQ